MSAPRHVSDYALEYVRRGWNPVPVYFKTKKPSGGEGWQTLVIREADVPKYFNGQPQNVGVLMGQTSGGLVDVDLDCPEAIAIAPFVLPRTGAIFGRPSARAAHWLYTSDLAPPEDNVADETQAEDNKAVLKFRDSSLFRKPGAGKVTLVELRIGGHKGAQTVFPGSTHETGETISWEESGEPAMIDGAELIKKVKLVAVGALFIRYWPALGARHDAALAVGGFMARAGYKPEWIKYFVERIAREAGCTDVAAKMKAAYDSATNTLAGEHTYGLKTIEQLFGQHVADKVAEWLDYKTRAGWTAGHGRSNDIVTEDSAAERFVEQHGEDLRYCHSSGAWYRWNGVHWERDQTCLVFHWARELARKTAEDLDASKRYITQKRAFASAVEALAKADPQIAVTADHWDHNPWLLGTPAGTVDLRTGKLREAARRDGITRVTLVAPSIDGCPLWLQFLEETTDNDEGLIRFLRQWCGYCLTGVTIEHAMLFVHGDGGNGKSVFINIVSSTLNDYAATAAMETFTASNSDKHPTDLAMLRGARLVTASETEAGRAWAETKIKQMTGGDRITARFMRQDFFTYMPQFKITIIGNNKPALHNVDAAARRRFNIVPFNRTPANPDTRLGEKLMAEAPAILQWMIEGCLDWQKNGLVRPTSVTEATEEYFSDQEVFPRWLEEECITHRGPGATIAEKSSVLYRSWSDYARSVGGKPGTQAEFKESMRKAGFPHRKRNNGREFVGVQLKPKQESEAEWPSAKPRF
jgi:putative DNA primase/helicase